MEQNKDSTFFYNPIDTEWAFGISRVLSDELNKIFREITPEKTKLPFLLANAHKAMSVCKTLPLLMRSNAA